MTGRFALSMPGVQTFRTRQSSLDWLDDRFCIIWISGVLKPGSCGLCGPRAFASRTPLHGIGFLGGRKRPAPSVDAPYGTPLKVRIPFTVNPRILPAVVSTITSDFVGVLAAAAATPLRARTRPA